MDHQLNSLSENPQHKILRFSPSLRYICDEFLTDAYIGKPHRDYIADILEILICDNDLAIKVRNKNSDRPGYGPTLEIRNIVYNIINPIVDMIMNEGFKPLNKYILKNKCINPQFRNYLKTSGIEANVSEYNGMVDVRCLIDDEQTFWEKLEKYDVNCRNYITYRVNRMRDD